MESYRVKAQGHGVLPKTSHVASNPTYAPHACHPATHIHLPTDTHPPTCTELYEASTLLSLLHPHSG